MTTDETTDRLYRLGDQSIRLLAEHYPADPENDHIEAKAMLAGTFTLLAAHRATDTSRGLRLRTLVTFTAALDGRYDQNNRVSLPTFVSCIDGEREGWALMFRIPLDITRLGWETLARLVRRHDVSTQQWYELTLHHPDYTQSFWRSVADHIRASVPELESVLY